MIERLNKKDKGYLQLFFNHATILCLMKQIIIYKKYNNSELSI